MNPGQHNPPSLGPNTVPTPPPSSEKAEKDKREGIKSILATIGILLLAPLLALFITFFVFQTYQVDGPSMETTLQNGDRLIVLKFRRTIARLTGTNYVPNRGDIIVFHKQGLTFEGGGDKQLIKRVIALPGERIVLKDGTYTVYNKDNPDGFEPDSTSDYSEAIQNTTGEEFDYLLGSDELFVSGDNRDNSLDSRSFGPIELKDVVGTAAVRILPPGKFKVL